MYIRKKVDHITPNMTWYDGRGSEWGLTISDLCPYFFSH